MNRRKRVEARQTDIIAHIAKARNRWKEDSPNITTAWFGGLSEVIATRLAELEIQIEDLQDET